jgi:hypothetical protein
MSIRSVLLIAAVATAVVVAGCGKSSSSSSSSSGSPGQGAGALSAEARSAATGDIPDNQVFLVFRDRAAGYSMRYPEGWAQRGAGRDVTFQDKNNLVHVVVASGSAPTAASVSADLARLQGTTPSLHARAARRMTIAGAPAVKALYTTVSAPNPVTGKRVKLTVDRYVLHRGGKVATVDLGTPVGVDNVDAYRLMIQSFRWA